MEKDLIGTEKYKAFQKETITYGVLTATHAPKNSLLGQGNFIEHGKLIAGLHTNGCWWQGLIECHCLMSPCCLFPLCHCLPHHKTDKPYDLAASCLSETMTALKTPLWEPPALWCLSLPLLNIETVIWLYHGNGTWSSGVSLVFASRCFQDLLSNTYSYFREGMTFSQLAWIKCNDYHCKNQEMCVFSGSAAMMTYFTPASVQYWGTPPNAG